MKLLNRHNKLLQKMIIVMIVIVMLFNVVFPPVASAVSIPLVGEIASLIAGAALNFVRFLADAVEGIMQYFFIGGTNSFWVLYTWSDLEEVEQHFADAGYDVQVLYDSLPQDADTSNMMTIDSSELSSFLGSFFTDAGTDYNVPFLLFTPDNIFSNRIAAFDINFIDPPQSSNGQQQTISASLRDTIATWYNALRTIALAGMLVVLVYVGIRMIISTSASDKAKYKSMLMDWFIAVCMLFVLHYIMLFTIRVTEAITSMISSASGTTDTWIEVTGDTTKYIRTNMMGAVRFQAENNDLSVQAGYTIMYIILIAYTAIFGFRYLKRVLNVAFLTIISPLIVIMYPIDKVGDGKAQGFSIWLKEYIFNALLQPLHLILYTVLLGSSISIMVSNNNPIYAIVALAFISQAEKFLKKIFDFDKANGGTVDSMGFAGGALAMGLMNRYSGKVFGRSSGGGKPGNSLPAEKNPGRELEKTNKGDYGSFLTPGSGANANTPAAAVAGVGVVAGTGRNGGNSGAVETGRGEGNQVPGGGQETQIPQEGTRDQNGIDQQRAAEFRGLMDSGLSQEEAMNILNQRYPDDRQVSPEPTTPGLINSDEARDEMNGDTGIRFAEDNPAIIAAQNAQPTPDYANMSTMDIMKQGVQNKIKNTTAKDVGKVVGKGALGAAKFAGKHVLPAIGAVAGATAGFALGASTGDLGNALKGIGIGAGAGIYAGRGTTKGITGAVGRATSGAEKAKYSLARSALGYEEAMKWRSAKLDTKQKKEFMKDKDNIAKAKDLAAKVGIKDHMTVMEDMYALKSARVNDDKMIEAALKVKKDNRLGQAEMVKLASDTSKKSETMLFGEAESKLLVNNLSQSFIKKSGGQLTEQQARDNATRYLENMRAMYNESR